MTDYFVSFSLVVRGDALSFLIRERDVEFFVNELFNFVSVDWNFFDGVVCPDLCLSNPAAIFRTVSIYDGSDDDVSSLVKEVLTIAVELVKVYFDGCFVRLDSCRECHSC